MPQADLRRAMRQRLALSVAESEARHRALLAALPDGVLLQDADGAVLLANPPACEMLEITSPDVPMLPGGVVPAPRLPKLEGGPDNGADTPLSQLATTTTDVALRTGQ